MLGRLTFSALDIVVPVVVAGAITGCAVLEWRSISRSRTSGLVVEGHTVVQSGAGHWMSMVYLIVNINDYRVFASPSLSKSLMKIAMLTILKGKEKDITFTMYKDITTYIPLCPPKSLER